MKILLISPSIDSEKRTTKSLMMPQLALYILKGLTPSKHQVTLLEEETETINLDVDCDLVGISCMTASAPRSYELCKEFRKRGKTVILGGVHPTILPDEALQHADCVVIGEAEGVWETVLNDFESNCLKRSYHEPLPDLSKYYVKDFREISKKRIFSLIPIMTTRGCPYNCDFCCVTNLFGKAIRHIPVENVVREIQESGAKNFMFLDDNIIGHPAYAKELFKAIKPLKIRWVGQASVSLLVGDDELMQLRKLGRHWRQLGHLHPGLDPRRGPLPRPHHRRSDSHRRPDRRRAGFHRRGQHPAPRPGRCTPPGRTNPAAASSDAQIRETA